MDMEKQMFYRETFAGQCRDNKIQRGILTDCQIPSGSKHLVQTVVIYGNTVAVFLQE